MVRSSAVAGLSAGLFRKPSSRCAQLALCSVLLAASPLAASVRLQVREGRPIVDSVFVNGHGPFVFLIDTGTNTNLIESGLADSLGMKAAFHLDLISSAGSLPMPGSGGNEIELGPAAAGGQQFLMGDLKAIRQHWPDVQGVLGQGFLSRFDYLLDLRGKRMEFGKQIRGGKRAPLAQRNGRAAVSTSLGDLVLDSGAAQLILFNVESERPSTGFLRTVTGYEAVRTVVTSLFIEGRNLWQGGALATSEQTEPGVAGLMPLSLFRSVYVCNSEGYVIFE